MSEVLQRLRPIPTYLRRAYEAVPQPVIKGAVGGIVNIVEDVLYENTAFYKIKPYLKHASEGVVPIITGAIGFLGREFAGIEELEVLEDSLALGIANMIRGAYRFYGSKRPFAAAIDASTIEGWNFDANDSVQIIVDGNNVTPSGLTTDANGHFKATLSSPLASGKHDLVVKTSKKAFHDVIHI